jgi:hypothetical protein
LALSIWRAPDPWLEPKGNGQTVVKTGSGLSGAGGRFETPERPAADCLVCVTSLAEQSHLMVQRGSVLRFRIADPKARLTRSNVSVVVSAPNNGFAHARVLSLTPSRAELYVAAPFNSKVAAVIDAPARVRNSGGASAPLRAPALPLAISREPTREISLTLE